jgi:hypothetical protein
MTETEMTPVTELYVRCSYPLRPDAIAASDTCQHPANTAVRDVKGNLWYRCPSHEGELTNGVFGEAVVTSVPRKRAAPECPGTGQYAVTGSVLFCAGLNTGVCPVCGIDRPLDLDGIVLSHRAVTSTDPGSDPGNLEIREPS